jgi:TatD DNase family protein
LKLADTHCHLNFEAFDADRSQVLARARQAGITRILNPAIDLETSQHIRTLAEEYPEVYAAVGVHPTSGGTWTADSLELLEALAQHNKVVAIGEIGLDYYWDKTPKSVQREVFIQQLRLAEALSLPVVIHNREATEDVLAILTEYQQELTGIGSELAARPGVLHSFSAGPEAAERAVRMKFFIGITGPVTFKKTEQLQSVVANVPTENLLVETDAPFLTPHPYRGKRNEPAFVQYVVEKIAAIKSQSAGELAEITSANAQRLFRWSKSA